eukprot:jgi/Tetstr1/445809/TSEL_033450.t1
MAPTSRSTLKGDVPKEHQRHLDKLQDIFKAAEEVLKGTELPKMQQGETGAPGSQPQHAARGLPAAALVNLTQAKDEIAAIEEVLHPELGERGSPTWASSERRMAYELDDDYSIMDDYLDYNELTPINDMHGEVEETQQVLRRYKHNLYRMEADNQHSQKIRSRRRERGLVRDRLQVEFDCPNGGGGVCREAGVLVRALAVAVALGLLGLQAAASYVSLSIAVPAAHQAHVLTPGETPTPRLGR